MGFRGALVLAATSFFMGVQYICFNVDYRMLYQEVTEQAVTDGFQFYATFFNAPPAIRALLHGMIGVAFLALLAKIHAWDESAMFFDGSSLIGYIFALAVYATVCIPALRTVVEPVKGVDSREDQIEAMRVLGAGNTIIIVLLIGVLLLQGGEEYARRAEARELAKMIAGEQKPAADATPVTPQEKKNQ
ncbi:hypothetical protein FIBSPDRAFT_854713 [Athelia psychrophila]|uniref:Shr3 amino acid permease chaperone n=1 Tax=Athelia psychrophila TaxID=1759441 RepID=A0A166Q198_9AGAM|nr:hypothetical protein FIBSPDRAFT_854713 [Fibularhizoctonia sp. CBS 109695]